MDSNTITLQNQDIWKELMELDLSTLNKKFLERKGDELTIRGHYTNINNNLIMFYRKNGLLYFNTDNKEICLDNENIKLSFQRKGLNNIFNIYDRKENVYNITYQSYRYDRLNMVDPDFNKDREEYQDFFLFIYNVINNPARRKRIYTSECD